MPNSSAAGKPPVSKRAGGFILPPCLTALSHDDAGFFVPGIE
jgi:hypothetical protein